MLRAAIYTRVSTDVTGRARSPQEQEADARRDCERAGWHVAAVYTDNDRGASRFSGVARPDFERLKKSMARSEVDIVVTWESSRMQRDLAAYVEVRDLCRAHSVRWSYNGRLYDLDDADDAFTTGLDALLSEREAEYLSKRTRRSMAANAVAGLPHGAVMLGYVRTYDARTGALTGQQPDPLWAPVIREMFDRVAAGDSLGGIARDLTGRDIRLPRTGGPWTGPRISYQLRNRLAYLGHRVHKGAVTVENAWPALVDEATFHRAQAVLGAPGRALDHWDGTPQSLMTGLMRCEVCDGRVGLSSIGRTTSKRTPRRNIKVYRCANGAHVSRGMARVDAVIHQQIIWRLHHEDLLEAFRPPDAPSTAMAELAEVRTRLDEVEAALLALTMPVAMGTRLATALDTRKVELERLTASSELTAELTDLAALDPDEREQRWWDTPSTGQRIVIAALMTDIVMSRVGCGSVATLGVSFRWIGSDEVVNL